MATARLLAAGFAATSLEAVAAEAGVSKRTLYARFPDKRALVLALVRRLVGLWLPGFGALLAGVGLEDGLRAAARRTLEVALSAEALALHRLLVAEGAGFPELAGVMREAGSGAGIEAVAGWLAAHRPGLGAARAAFLAEQFQHLVVAGPQARAAGSGAGLDPAARERWCRESVALFLHGLPPG